MFERYGRKLADGIRIRSNVTIEVRGLEGQLLQRQHVRNKVVNTGLDLLMERLQASPVSGGITHFAVGTGDTTPAATDVALETEVLRDTITQFVSVAATKLTVKYFLGTGSANGSTLSECGEFNASSSGVMYARATFTPIAKTSSKTITFSHDLNITAV